MKKTLLLLALVTIFMPHSSHAVDCTGCDVSVSSVDDITTDGTTSNGLTVYFIKAKLPGTGTVSTCPICFMNKEWQTVKTCGRGTQITSNGAASYTMDAVITQSGTQSNGRLRVYRKSDYIYCSQCPLGSYNPYDYSVNAGNCTPCSGGYFTTGPGLSGCTTKCSGYDYAATWETVTCTGSSCSNVCKAKTCKAGAYLDNGVCKPCPTGTYMATDGNTATSCTKCLTGTGYNTDCDATGLTWYRCIQGYYDADPNGTGGTPYCEPCPLTDYYTTSALTTKARGTTGGLTTKASHSDCYLPAGTTYYDAMGAFEFSNQCSF